MGKTTKPKVVTLSTSRDIPFDKLILSQANVRRIQAGVSIEELAEDIARRTLLQSLTVRAVVDEAGCETGIYEIPAGGRRYRALERLVQQKRLSPTAPIACIIREGGLAEEDSLAENVQRAPLHPLDQFRAFLAMREKGRSEEEIAAAFFVSVAVVKQRLRLASVSPKLLDIYAEDALTLDQLMAFTVTGDHERQEQAFERLASAYDKSAYTIRRMLTEGAVRASDKRVQYVGLDAYAQAGGPILRDLFQTDDGGWLQDVGLVDRLVAEKLEQDAAAVRAEGWKWIEVAPDFAYGHTFGLRQLRGEPPILSDEEEAARAALQAEYDRLEEEHAEADELPEEIDRRLAELETALLAFEDRPPAFDPADVAIAGAFVSLSGDGRLRVERGFVRHEDERPVEPEGDEGAAEDGGGAGSGDPGSLPGGSAAPPSQEEEEDGLTPLSDRLLTELSAHRTVALRRALGERPDLAILAALHALCLKVFYTYTLDTCLGLDLTSVSFGVQVPGLADSAPAVAIGERHASWRDALPSRPEDLWAELQGWDGDSRDALFAHCVAMSVNAVHEAWARRPRAHAHADQLAQALDLDMAAAGWEPTVDGYLGRVTKARILEAVREGCGEAAADRLTPLKKGDMAEQAQPLLAGSGWLPTPLRTPGKPFADTPPEAGPEEATSAETEPHAIAAE